MRVTIGERLGRLAKATLACPLDNHTDDAVPTWIDVEVAGPVVDLRTAPSSSAEWGQRITVDGSDDGGPARVRGEMVWLHKCAPTLVIDGRPGLTPEEHAAGRRR